VLDYLGDPSRGSLCADYRLLCSGSIYRQMIGEWYKSEGARFLLAPPLLLYAASRPFDEYPLEMVLRLTVPQLRETDGHGSTIFHTDEEVARDIAALMTVLCRRLITVMGKSAERIEGYDYPEFDHIPLPVATSMRKVYWPPYPLSVITSGNFLQQKIEQKIEDNNPPPKPVDPEALTALLTGLPRVAHAESIVASARLYALALEFIREQPDIAYQLLISSVETIANDALRDFQPDDAEKIDYQRPVFDLAMALNLGEETARKLALEACKNAPWAGRKFRKFLIDNVGVSVWEQEDDLFSWPTLQFLPRQEDFEKTLKTVYDARSKATHSGEQFPISASYSGGPRIPWRVAAAMMASATQGTGTTFPPVVWFERIVNVSIRTFWQRSISASGGASLAGGE
jgi:hypothetical protein